MKRTSAYILSALVLVALVSAASYAEDLAGKVLYLQTNLFYEKPTKMFSTNYHKGKLLPAGTKVKIQLVGSEAETGDAGMGGVAATFGSFPQIVFKTLEGKVLHKIRYVRNHHDKVKLNDLASMYFKETDPLKSSAYAGFTNKEKDAIKKGVVTEGMSKEAVIMAWGYPPQHQTPSTEYNSWIYWYSRYVRKIVEFDDNGRVKRVL